MTPEETYAAAIEAAKGYLIAAGFTFDDATGMFTAAPEGAKLSYEVIIPGDGLGDHPSFAVLTAAQEALATIGIELAINDPADSNVLWDALDAGDRRALVRSVADHRGPGYVSDLLRQQTLLAWAAPIPTVT